MKKAVHVSVCDRARGRDEKETARLSCSSEKPGGDWARGGEDKKDSVMGREII
jgi:hypothetical protein